MANPAKLTVRTIVGNSALPWPAVDTIDTTGMVPVVAADMAGRADHVALLVTARGAVSARVAAGDMPPAMRQPLGDLSVPLASALRASLEVDPAGGNNGIIYTANRAGSDGNRISIEYVDPGANDQALRVEVANRRAIRVYLKTGAAGAIASTAEEIIAAVNGHWFALHLVTAVGSEGSTGKGVVTAMAATNLAGGADMDATHAELTTALVGDDNDLEWVAVVGGAEGNEITIEYVDPSVGGQPLGVVVVGTAITVNLATGGGGAITSTAADIRDEVANTPAAAALVVGTDVVGNDGSGVVTAMAATALEGGAGLTALYGPFESSRFTQDNGDLNIDFEIINGEADVICFRLPRG